MLLLLAIGVLVWLAVLLIWPDDAKPERPARASVTFVDPRTDLHLHEQWRTEELVPRVDNYADVRSVLRSHPRPRLTKPSAEPRTTSVQATGQADPPITPSSGGGSVVALIHKAFCSAGICWQGDTAVAKADCESRLDPSAHNPSGASGLFQLMPFWWDGENKYGWVFDPYDAWQNAYHAALIVVKDSTWTNWVC